MSEPWNLSPMARSGAVTHVLWRKGQPQAPYQADFSVRTGHWGQDPWPARLSWRQQQKLSAVFGFPTYALRHARHRGQGSLPRNPDPLRRALTQLRLSLRRIRA